MNILVTGNHGYIGTVLTSVLLEKEYDVVGLDIDYFKDCFLEPVEDAFPQINTDIRTIESSDVEGFDGIIHLAALSNDPLGELNPGLTEEINYQGTVNIARLAKKAGVKRFVYASSQSMYGISDTENELDEDDSEKNPVTAYAKTKWEAELELKKMHSNDFVVACFRPSTVFGASPRFRSDIVYNNLVACAYTIGKIEILSDGSPWRPVVHVKDVCQAYISGLEAPPELVGGKAFNVGIPEGNFTVKELAEAAQRSVPGCDLVFLNEHTDPRTYRVSFRRILSELKDYFQPEYDLDRGGMELVDYFDKVNFTEKDFRGRTCNRLAQLKFLQENHSINNQLRFSSNEI
jgi:nucleoside-diphosphate-sugar epimerase